MRSKFLCEIYKTQCWLDGLVGWWLGRGWYVAQQDCHLSTNRATGNSKTLESSSKKTQCYLFACRPGRWEGGCRLPKEPVEDMLRPVIILSVVLFPSLDALTLNNYTLGLSKASIVQLVHRLKCI